MLLKSFLYEIFVTFRLPLQVLNSDIILSKFPQNICYGFSSDFYIEGSQEVFMYKRICWTEKRTSI